MPCRQDLTDLPGRLPHNFDSLLSDFYNPLAKAAREMPKPVVCAVNGVAAGAGANLALSADIVIAARSARFIQAFTSIGLVPDTGGSWLLPRLIGDARARALVMLGTHVDAVTAAEWGMIWQVVDEDEVMNTAIQTTEQLAARPTRALAESKALLNAAMSSSFTDQLDRERHAQQRLGATSDYAEGLSSFLKKRTPSFMGR